MTLQSDLPRSGHDSDSGATHIDGVYALGQGNVIASAKWSFGSNIGRQIIQFVGNVVLARVLDPSDFGLAAVVLVVVTFAQNFTDLGIGPAIVQSSKLSDRLLSSAFWANCLSGLFLTALTCLLAHPLAIFFHEPKLVDIMYLGSLNFSLSIYAVHQALLERTLRFADVGVIEGVSAGLGMAVACGCAVAGLGAISIIMAPVATTLFTSVLYTYRVPWTPSSFMHKPEMITLWRFSSWLVLFNTVNYWTRSTDNIVLGRYSSPLQLGLYARAYDLMLLPVQQVATVMSRMLLPVMASARESQARLADAWLDAVYASWIIGLPISLGTIVAAPALVTSLFGQAWQGSAELVGILAISVAPQLIARTLGAVYQALDQTATQFRLGLYSAVITVTAVVIGVHWGATGVAIGTDIGLYAAVFVNLPGVLKSLDVRLTRVARLLWRSFLANIFMGLVAIIPRILIASDHKFIVLTLQVLSGLLAYAAALYVVDRKHLLVVRQIWGRDLGLN